MNVKSIVAPEVLVIMLFVAVTGYFIMSKIVNRKYGYTKKREKELENRCFGYRFFRSMYVGWCSCLVALA